MEFKGTKGKWELYFDDRSLEKYIKTEHKFIARVGFGNEENNANALLISKAPEMLEMLQKAKVELSRIKGAMMAHPDCTEGSEFDDYTNSAEEIENEIEQLIKQATEI